MHESSLHKTFQEHTKRYPKMETQDYVKLLFKHTFGPAHFSNGLNPARVKNYLMKELETFQPYAHTPYIESIGNGYVRVSLACLVDGIMSVENLIECFLASAKRSDETHNTFKSQFFANLDALKSDYDFQPWIAYFNRQGIVPIRHSDLYKAHYFPHYRLVEQSLLSKYIDVDVLMKRFPKASCQEDYDEITS